jgi:hypothetical protein
LNIAIARAPTDHPLLGDFMAALDSVNAVADASPGFVWRLQTEDGDATAIRPFDDERTMVNMSVWRSLPDLRRFVYSERAHLDVMRRRREWFERMDVYLVLWWVPAGHLPAIEEAKERLALLRERGPGPEAFSFREPYGPPDAADDLWMVDADDAVFCPAG